MSAILQPGEVDTPNSAIPFLRLAERSDVFAHRARRFQSLAEGHALADYLRFMARLAEAQQAALDDFPAVPLPSREQLELYRRHGLPALGAQGWERDWAWRAALKQIMEMLRKEGLTGAASEAVDQLEQTSAAELERYATNLLAQDFAAVPPGAAPFVAAALQVYWTFMATALGEDAYGRLEGANLCPVCGSPPAASIVRIGAADSGLRYLCCSLCSSQWHMVRIKCASCDTTKGIAYYGIEGKNGAVQAEACDECDSYLKIMKMDKDPEVDPAADDLATLALDMLMDASGRKRGGPNLLFHPGAD